MTQLKQVSDSRYTIFVPKLERIVVCGAAAIVGGGVISILWPFSALGPRGLYFLLMIIAVVAPAIVASSRKVYFDVRTRTVEEVVWWLKVAARSFDEFSDVIITSRKYKTNHWYSVVLIGRDSQKPLKVTTYRESDGADALAREVSLLTQIVYTCCSGVPADGFVRVEDTRGKSEK
jgi:hypothetical protein